MPGIKFTGVVKPCSSFTPGVSLKTPVVPKVQQLPQTKESLPPASLIELPPVQENHPILKSTIFLIGIGSSFFAYSQNYYEEISDLLQNFLTPIGLSYLSYKLGGVSSKLVTKFQEIKAARAIIKELEKEKVNEDGLRQAIFNLPPSVVSRAFKLIKRNDSLEKKLNNVLNPTPVRLIIETKEIPKGSLLPDQEVLTIKAEDLEKFVVSNPRFAWFIFNLPHPGKIGPKEIFGHVFSILEADYQMQERQAWRREIPSFEGFILWALQKARFQDGYQEEIEDLRNKALTALNEMQITNACGTSAINKIGNWSEVFNHLWALCLPTSEQAEIELDKKQVESIQKAVKSSNGFSVKEKEIIFAILEETLKGIKSSGGGEGESSGGGSASTPTRKKGK